MPSYQPGLGVEVGRLGRFTDHRGRFKGAYRSLDASGAVKLFGQMGLEPAQVQAAADVVEAVGVVADQLDEGGTQ